MYVDPSPQNRFAARAARGGGAAPGAGRAAGAVRARARHAALVAARQPRQAAHTRRLQVSIAPDTPDTIYRVPFLLLCHYIQFHSSKIYDA